MPKTLQKPSGISWIGNLGQNKQFVAYNKIATQQYAKPYQDLDDVQRRDVVKTFLLNPYKYL